MEFKVEKKCTLELNEFEMTQIMYAFNLSISKFEGMEKDGTVLDSPTVWKEFMQSLYAIQSKLIRANELMKLK